MRGCRFLLIALVGSTPALGDVGPPQPAPPPPAGPDKAVIRGMEVTRAYAYWKGRRWLTFLKVCTPTTQDVCQKHRVSERPCIVVGIDGSMIAGGDIAALTEAEKKGRGRPVKLRLENCGDLDDLELKP